MLSDGECILYAVISAVIILPLGYLLMRRLGHLEDEREREMNRRGFQSPPGRPGGIPR